MRILVVEDETAIADFVQRGLESEGYAVACAYDGDEGERKALGDSVDLVVLDLMLPGKDGLTVLRSIREEKPALPVIVLTAREDDRLTVWRTGRLHLVSGVGREPHRLAAMDPSHPDVEIAAACAIRGVGQK